MLAVICIMSNYPAEIRQDLLKIDYFVQLFKKSEKTC